MFFYKKKILLNRDNNFWKMLTCALRLQDKDLKIEVKNKYCIEKQNF